jgi:ribonuclease P protein component
MISKTNRFHGRNSLNTVYQKGRAVRGDYISLRYIPTRRADYRLAVVVSKKVSKSAVVRNRIRRRVYEIVRLYRQENSEPWPVDLVVSVFDERAAGVEHEELRGCVLKLLEKCLTVK